jgi:hypothetical protein
MDYDTLELKEFENSELKTIRRPTNDFLNRRDGNKILDDDGFVMDKSQKVSD